MLCSPWLFSLTHWLSIVLEETFFGGVGFDWSSDSELLCEDDLRGVNVDLGLSHTLGTKGNLTKFLCGENGGWSLSLAECISKVKHCLSCTLDRVVSRNFAWQLCHWNCWVHILLAPSGQSTLAVGQDCKRQSQNSQGPGVVNPAGHSANQFYSESEIQSNKRIPFQGWRKEGGCYARNLAYSTYSSDWSLHEFILFL